VVVGLLLWTAYDMGRSVFGAAGNGWAQALAQSWDKLAFAAAAFIILTVTRLNPAFLILGAAALGLTLYR
jgi:hypothetical protein